MSATITGISRITWEAEPTFLVQITHIAHGLNGCRRGLLVDENCLIWHQGKSEYRLWAMRYVECSEIIDEIFPRNRCAPATCDEKGE